MANEDWLNGYQANLLAKEANRIAKERLQLAKDKIGLARTPAEPESGISPIVWTGTLRELATLAIGNIQAKSNMDALKKICQHFVKPDGSPITARSLWQNYKNKKDI